MRSLARRARANAGALSLLGAAACLFALLYAADARLGLHSHASNRYRFHAIPVAVSRLHHGRAHDYTAFRALAHRFHDGARDLDGQIRESLDRDPGADTYFWVADDRGLADYVAAAFVLFGPEVRSLSHFWFLLLGASVVFFAVGFRHRPATLALPVFVLFGLLVLAEAVAHREAIPFDRRVWQEDVALYESRLFDALSLVAVMHLALVALGRGNRAAWLAAIPQLTLFVFLYHCRSSLGWQVVALSAVVAGRAGWCLYRRRPAELVAPVTVGLLLAVSLVGLKYYQRAAYHPAYFAQEGPRTFWHNALMGLSHHPKLRSDLPMRQCEDRDAIDLVLARMEEADPALDRNRWNWMAALNSLGSHNPFDWVAYEAAARAAYFELWRTRPRQMLACHALYKPLAVAKQSWAVVRVAGREAVAGRAWELLASVVVFACALFGLVRAGRRSASVREDVRAPSLLVLALLPFALIPAVAFYPAVTTTGGFFVAGVALAGLAAVQVVWRHTVRGSA
jgi:hypothetical protein